MAEIFITILSLIDKSLDDVRTLHMASIPGHTLKRAPQQSIGPMFRNGRSLSFAVSDSHASTSLLRIHNRSFAHCAVAKVGDDDDEDEDGEEDSLMCRSTFEIHFILGFQTLCYWEHSFVRTFSFQMIVISIGKCQHIVEWFVVLRA